MPELETAREEGRECAREVVRSLQASNGTACMPALHCSAYSRLLLFSSTQTHLRLPHSWPHAPLEGCSAQLLASPVADAVGAPYSCCPGGSWQALTWDDTQPLQPPAPAAYVQPDAAPSA